MNESILFLAITYAALAILLLGLFIYSTAPFWVKAASILLVGSFFFVTHHSLNGMLGWPTKRELPEKFLMIASRVIEPDKKSKAMGDIYIWAAAINAGEPNEEPRAYHLTYTPELHEELEKAGWRMRRGVVQVGHIEKIETPNEVRDDQRTIQQVDKIVIYDLPDPQLPEK